MSITENNHISQQTAHYLLEAKAVQFSFQKPFQWSSGWLSPVYCDSRLTLSYPEIRGFIKSTIIDAIKRECPEVEGIAGVATAGVPQAAMIADQMALPLIYVRSKAKAHGKGNQIEGRVVEGQKIVVIEDVISTGKSSIAAVEALQAAGLDVLGVFGIFTYGFDFASERFQQKGLKLFTLTDYTQLVVEIFKQDGVSEKVMASLHEWRKHPDKWKPEI